MMGVFGMLGVGLMLFVLRLILRNAFRHKLRTTLTVVGWSALLISLPVILYQAYAFVVPAFAPGLPRFGTFTQGAIVTLNGGRTWSSWYNQPTGQFYHLAADNRFPYWVYSGQQDSGTVSIAMGEAATGGCQNSRSALGTASAIGRDLLHHLQGKPGSKYSVSVTF